MLALALDDLEWKEQIREWKRRGDDQTTTGR